MTLDMTGRPFRKMHGLGNDFVIFEAGPEIDPAQARALADRRRGIGCDQVIRMTASASPEADLRMDIWNADGGRVGACGNASRCVAALYFRQSGADHVRIRTDSGIIEAFAANGGQVTVDMGRPGLGWQDIPLTEAVDTLALPRIVGALPPAVAVSMGNPHAVFFVDDADAAEVAALGCIVEQHPLFAEGTNTEFAEVRAPDRIRMRVWERGAGQTPACGTGACATLVAAARRGLTGRKATLELDGGALFIDWRERDDHVMMTGPVAESFAGVVDAGLMSCVARERAA